MPLEMLTRR